MTKQFLWNEYVKAKDSEKTKDCRTGCNGCGLLKWGLCNGRN